MYVYMCAYVDVEVPTKVQDSALASSQQAHLQPEESDHCHNLSATAASNTYIYIYIYMYILGGSWDLVSRVISTLIGVISNYNYSFLTYNPSY